MREVNVRILHFGLDLARTGEIDEAPLLEGLASIAPREGVIPSWFDWDDFVELWERLERALGGPEGFARVARLAGPVAYPEFRVFAALFVSPLSLFSYMMLRHSKTSFRILEVEELERFEDGRIRWREHIPEPYRASEAFHRSTRTMASLIPMHLDLPEAPVEMIRMTPRSAEFIATFAQPPLATRGRQAVSAAAALVTSQLESMFELVVERTRDEGPQAFENQAASAAHWAKELQLSPRQREVFALVVEGRANKAIAEALACSERNVEFHVGRIFRAAKVTSRSELLVKVLGPQR